MKARLMPLVVVLACTTAATTARAQEAPAEPDIGDAVACRRDAGCTSRPQLLDDVRPAAEAAGVEPADVLGALNTLADAGIETDATSYLRSSGDLPVPAPVASAPTACTWPICGALGRRIFCIEAIESSHGAAMYNPRPWHGEHAQGWLGWLPSTARRWGAAIGNRWSEWQAAAAMILAGQGRQFAGIAWGRC